MRLINRPDKVTADSFSDPNLKYANNNGYFSQFTNALNTPILDVKGIQLLRANFVNPSLPLYDWNGQCIFVYAKNSNTTIPDSSVFHTVRLHPSWYVPATGYGTYVKNSYYNNGTELASNLNIAASAGGDSTLYNPSWLSNDVSFSYNTATRKISFQGLSSSNYYSPVPADHPALPAFLSTYTGPDPTGIKMNALGFSGSYANALPQPFVNGVTMNSRLGYGLSYNTRGLFWTGASVKGCATTTGIPQSNGIATEADSWPIMLGIQQVNVYLSVITGSGLDSGIKKNLLATIPIENASLGVNSYTLSSVEKPAKSVANEIYTLQFDFTDEEQNPVYFPPNMNVNMELNLFY
jgi:hypothetical protein